ncbi:DUF742 domain-containing protein [Actinosynnema sp. NPDC020468]|uniref:DUF742 domain-containing protein n=1 Tax=Actinosynnema sp. NPDC020468 TaxID=3154488 RepID=UPI0033C92329
MSPDPESPSEQTFADLLNGFSFDSSRRRRPDPAGSAPLPRGAESPAYPEEEYEEYGGRYDDFDFGREEAASIVRAYSWTGGRTTSSYQLEIETLVSAVEWDYPPGGPMKAEYQDVIHLVGRPRSVAEVAALLRLPLGVAKVLLGDMAERGLIDVHQTGAGDGAQPDLGLMERVLAGLRRL